jgi:heptosyltransferase III
VKILVLKRDKVGDMLLTTPLLRVLREALPDARIEVLASDYNAWVLDGNRDVDRVHAYRRTRIGNRISIVGALQQVALLTRLRFADFDVAIAAGGEASPRAMRRARTLGAKRLIAYVKAGESTGPDEIEEPVEGHERDRMLALLAPLGIRVEGPPPLPAYIPPEKILAWARSWLSGERLEPGRYVVIGLGARRAKRQPAAEQVLRWSAWLLEEHGLATVFMWTPGASDDPAYPGDDAIAQPVLDAHQSAMHAFRGPLPEAIGLVWLARTSVFPDSGLMHFAAASPGGVVGLFAQPESSPPPEQWGPLGRKCAVIQAPVAIADIADVEFTSAVCALLRD